MLEDKLHRLRTLEKGWDGYDAMPPKAALLELTETVLLELEKNGIDEPDSVFAIGEDEVCIEWYYKDDDPDKVIWRLILSTSCKPEIWKSGVYNSKHRSDFFDLEGTPQDWVYSIFNH